MVESSVADIIESVRRVDRATLAAVNWSQMPSLQTMLASLGPASCITTHDVDAFTRCFRGSRDYLGYLLHALAGVGRDIHQGPETFENTLQSLGPVFDLPQAERSRWIERAAAVSDSIGELHWLLLMQLANWNQAHWLIDPAWADSSAAHPGLPASDCVLARLISFSVYGANYRLAGDWVERDSSIVDNEPVVQFGWTDEDKNSILWYDSHQELFEANRAADRSVAVVRSFASIPLFYASRMLEGVVVFRRGADTWEWASVNGLDRDAWRQHLQRQGVDLNTIASLETYYETLRTRLLPTYADQTEGNLLISLAFTVVPRTLGTTGRRAATVFAKLFLGGPTRVDLTLTNPQLHAVTNGLWQSVNQLKVPVLRRLTAEVIDTTDEKSARLVQQASLLDDMRLRLRDLSRDASALEQKARELNLQIAGSPVDMDLPYARVAQLYDETYTLRSRYRPGISINHKCSGYSKAEAQSVLCAALSDLMGQPREIEPDAVAAVEGSAAWAYLSNAERQLDVRLDLLFQNIKNRVWGADHIAALLMDLRKVRLPELPDDESSYTFNDLHSHLINHPARALLNLKSRFFDLGRRGRGRALQLHVLAPLLPLAVEGRLPSPWEQLLWQSDAFTMPGAPLAFLRAVYEKVAGHRLENESPLRVKVQQRCEVSRLPSQTGTAWSFDMPASNPYYLEPQFAGDLARLADDLHTGTPEPSIQGPSDTLGPFAALLRAVRVEWLSQVTTGFADGALWIRIPHTVLKVPHTTLIKTSPTSVEIRQERQ